MNTKTFETLEYNKLKEIVKGFCTSGLGKDLIDRLQPSSNINVVTRRLKETSEAKNILNNSNYVPLQGLYNIKDLIEKVSKGVILHPEELVMISDLLRGCRKIKKFMMSQEFYAPILSEYANSITELQKIEEEINYSIKGNRIDSSATKELKRIRRHIENTEVKIEDRLNKFITSSKNKKYIQEFFISKRNERYVVPIKASYKNQVQGVIVDASSKGSTVFIEPSSVSKLNIELVSLKAEEMAEEYQILAYLTGIIYENLKAININLELMAEYDMVFAKAKYSNKIKGIEPKINTNGYIKLINVKHPLLKGEVVPLEFEVGKDYRSLIITGPNAGGKTIVLKTIGILTLAVQSGFHIEAQEGTEFSVFQNIFVDIGDNQSIENSLSTFSSHIKNIAEIMRGSNKSTLILFDEIGTGTEPNEGAGLAIAILEELYHMGCISIATTHYAEIKKFSQNHPEFENACMKFNAETLEPLYKLIIGRSGESNALWISKKMGLKTSVLERAKKYIDRKEYNFELVKRSKINKNDKVSKNINEEAEKYEFRKGDKVKLLETNECAIVYKERDEFNNIEVLTDDKFEKVNIKRVILYLKREELYPEGYDLDSLFISYGKRKLEKDIERGSKKALKKIQKDMRKRNNDLKI
ncbi:endonuclease MutS2 [Clostridium ganghwense]|uniref:Endonuclease MutS2 n=1 Tax=Clostridium ganghwense TaxID=312089 RepID=A0ABT4CTM0_9CLOT|nr:endonuclease MutS2 [Clostridium ganghwense]MCY6371309.1 endonuclease MutS2 [Clostridium ganghwense]